MWTADNRPRYNRDKLRYPSDLTDAEWAHIEPLIPPGKPGGGKRRVAIREVINGVMYILSTGCQWRALPKGWCRKVGGKLENWRKLRIVKHSERRCAAAERNLRHETSYGIDVAQSIFR